VNTHLKSWGLPKELGLELVGKPLLLLPRSDFDGALLLGSSRGFQTDSKKNKSLTLHYHVGYGYAYFLKMNIPLDYLITPFFFYKDLTNLLYFLKLIPDIIEKLNFLLKFEFCQRIQFTKIYYLELV